MKALTVAQPWASLIAHGHKTIETRPSPPNGPMRPDGVRGLPGLAVERGERIAIHAGATGASRHTDPVPWRALYRANGGAVWPPLGAVVATAVVADALPISRGLPAPRSSESWIAVLGGHRTNAYLRRRSPVAGIIEEPVTGQLPLGDFTPGRWGWLLTDVRRIDPVPCKGRQGVWSLPADVADAVGFRYPGHTR